MESLKIKLRQIIDRAEKRLKVIRPSIDSKVEGLTAHGGWSVGYIEGVHEGLLTALELIQDSVEEVQNSVPSEFKRDERVRLENVETRYEGGRRFNIYPSIENSMFWTLEIKYKGKLKIIRDIGMYSTVEEIIRNYD